MYTLEAKTGGGPRKWVRLQSFKAGLPNDPLSPVRLCFLKAPEPSQAVPLAGDQAFKCEPVGGISYSKPQCPCVQTTKLCGLSSFVWNLYPLCSMCVALAVNSLSFSFLHHPKGPRGYRYGHSVITCREHAAWGHCLKIHIHWGLYIWSSHWWLLGMTQ